MIHHAYSAYNPSNPETRRRMALAKKTWSTQPWKDCPITERRCRMFHDRCGIVPYIKDIFNAATDGKPPSDIIVFTNSDICVSPLCAIKIAGALQSIDAAYSFRRDFKRLDAPLPDGKIKVGAHYCGSDLYAFRVGWWKKYEHEFPDMLLGREAWDAVLRILIEDTHPDRNCTLHNLIYHEWHPSTWENPSNKRTIRSQMYNVELARNWMFNYGRDPRSIGL